MTKAALENKLTETQRTLADVSQALVALDDAARLYLDEIRHGRQTRVDDSELGAWLVATRIMYAGAVARARGGAA